MMFVKLEPYNEPILEVHTPKKGFKAINGHGLDRDVGWLGVSLFHAYPQMMPPIAEAPPLLGCQQQHLAGVPNNHGHQANPRPIG